MAGRDDPPKSHHHKAARSHSVRALTLRASGRTGGVCGAGGRVLVSDMDYGMCTIINQHRFPETWLGFQGEHVSGRTGTNMNETNVDMLKHFWVHGRSPAAARPLFVLILCAGGKALRGSSAGLNRPYLRIHACHACHPPKALA